MRAARYFSPLLKLCSKMAPVRTLRSLALMMAPARASLMCWTLTMLSSCPSISNIVPTLKSLLEIKQELHRHQVATKAEPADHAHRRRRGHAAPAELLGPGQRVGDVDLQRRHRQRAQAIVEGVRVVGQRRRVDNDAGRPRRLLLEAVDQLALGVALEEDDLAAELPGPGADLLLQVGQGSPAVDLRLPRAQQVQVGAVGDDDPLHGRASRTAWETSRASAWWPGSARPSSRGSTQATCPARAFLSRGMASRMASAATAGNRPGRPKPASS